jgi:hypothetical protein
VAPIFYTLPTQSSVNCFTLGKTFIAPKHQTPAAFALLRAAIDNQLLNAVIRVTYGVGEMNGVRKMWTTSG